MPAALLLVDHGSRLRDANAQLDALAELVRERLPGRVVHAAHLEIAEPSVSAGIDACVADGAREILIHPFFLAPGRHATEDLPRLAREGESRHAGVSIRVGPPLGLHPALVDAVLARVAEAERDG